MAGIQHGIASVGTIGENTDAILKRSNREAFLLTAADRPTAFTDQATKLLNNPEYRSRIAESGRRLYDANFSFQVTAARFHRFIQHPRSDFTVEKIDA